MAKLIKEKQFIGSYGLASSGNYTPYWFDSGSGKKFICNLIVVPVIHPVKSDKFIFRVERQVIARRLLDLRRNKYQFVSLHRWCKFLSPLDVIEFVKSNGYKFSESAEIYTIGNDTFDFEGSVNGCDGTSFHFRIYDLSLLNEIKSAMVEAINQ